ncbi:SURF1 family protein [Chitinimonas naiadis]
MPLRKPRLLIVIATVLFVALTVRLGFWQLDRGQQKAARASQMAAMDKLAAVGWQGETGEGVWLRRYQVKGRWHPEAQIFLDNRLEAGRPGFHALAPLELADGRWLLINRGWLPKVVGQLPTAPLPEGEVRLLVRLVTPTQHYVELAADKTGGVVWQNLDWDRYRQMSKAPLAAALAYQLDGKDGLSRNWPAPDLGVEKHYAYAGQWFLFAALAVALFIILHWKRRST